MKDSVFPAMKKTKQNKKTYVRKDDFLTAMPPGPERPLSPGIPAGPC